MRGRFGFSPLNIPVYRIPVFPTVYLSGAHEQLCEETGNRSPECLEETLLKQEEMKDFAERGQDHFAGEAEAGCAEGKVTVTS